jgi:hypothetical protein
LRNLALKESRGRRETTDSESRGLHQPLQRAEN